MDDFLLADVIIDTVARAGGVKRRDLCGRRAAATLAKLRDTARFLIRQRTKLSFPEIATLFGRQNHTSVMAAVRREQTRLDRNVPHAASQLTQTAWHAHLLALVDQELIERSAAASAPKEEA
jgi:chromosomal replication initiation ATPase DnaA